MAKRSVTPPDFVLAAAGVFLSSWPKCLKTGKDILASLEEKGTSEVEPWEPFEHYDGHWLAEEIGNLSDTFENMWEQGFRSGARVFPTASAKRNYNRTFEKVLAKGDR